MYNELKNADAKAPFDMLHRYNSPKFGTFFLAANLTTAKKDEIAKAHSDIIDVVDEYDDLRSDLYTAYADSDDELIIDDALNQRQERLMIARGPKDTVDKTDKYWYTPSQGKGAVVYFIDTGININHPEFRFAKKDRIKTIFSGPGAPPVNLQHRDIDHSLRFSHGSAVAGLVIGNVTGIASAANMVMVTALDRDGKCSEPLYLDALARLYDDIEATNKDKKVIINISMSAGYFTQNSPSLPGIRDALKEVWNELKGLNVLFTVAMGTTERGESTDYSWPLKEYANTPNMIPVGAVDTTGSSIYQNATFLKVYAPGWSVKIASNIGYQLSSGTSFATALTSGILANYFSEAPSLTVQDAKDRLEKYAYSKDTKKPEWDFPKVVWMGHNKPHAQCVVRRSERGPLIAKRSCIEAYVDQETKVPPPDPDEPLPTETGTADAGPRGGDSDPDDENLDDDDPQDADPFDGVIDDDDPQDGDPFDDDDIGSSRSALPSDQYEATVTRSRTALLKVYPEITSTVEGDTAYYSTVYVDQDPQQTPDADADADPDPDRKESHGSSPTSPPKAQSSPTPKSPSSPPTLTKGVRR
ncbi:Oryzin [Arthrobotrys entomopaga]|nr:Oryzin [Arthrobotrys entomopaga]